MTCLGTSLRAAFHASWIVSSLFNRIHSLASIFSARNSSGRRCSASPRVVRFAPNRAAAPRDSRFGQNECLCDLAIQRLGNFKDQRVSTLPGRARPGTTQELRRTSDTGYTSSLSQANILSSSACYSCSIFCCYRKNQSKKFLSGLI